MKIYSWNMLYKNPDLDRAFSFIQGLDFDVLCLQEVPEEFLARLERLPTHLAYALDSERAEANTNISIYCVILSPHPVLASGSIEIPVAPQSWQTRLFMWLMHPLGWRRIVKKGNVFADIDMPSLGRVRLFSLHLTLATPAGRLREFGIAMDHRDPATRSIVCGDFNVLEHARVTLLNWLLGGRPRDIFAWYRERAVIEKRFGEFALQNPLRGKPTQTISHSQLDHILVPNTLRVSKAEVLPDRAGSDHHPIFIECE